MNSWLDSTEYPFAAHIVNIDGHQLHYIDEGTGETLLFVHGTPSWSFDYRHVIRALSGQHRCLAIDHIGFGLSDKPADYDYSPQQHSRNLEAFILDRQLDNITLVVHDFGGPIGLNVAIRHPERFRRLIILNSWLWDSSNDPEFIQFSSVLRNPLLPFLYRYLNFSARFVLPASFGKQKLSAHIRRQYTQPFPKPSTRNGPLAFVRSLLRDQAWFGKLWNQRHRISNKPTLFIWGMKDPIIKPHYLTHFMSGFPTAMVVRLDTCGHFPQEEQPKQVATAIQSWMLTASPSNTARKAR